MATRGGPRQREATWAVVGHSDPDTYFPGGVRYLVLGLWVFTANLRRNGKRQVGAPTTVFDAEQVLDKGGRRKLENSVHQGCFCGGVAGPVGMLLGVPIFSSFYQLFKEATIQKEQKKHK